MFIFSTAAVLILSTIALANLFFVLDDWFMNVFLEKINHRPFGRKLSIQTVLLNLGSGVMAALGACVAYYNQEITLLMTTNFILLFVFTMWVLQSSMLLRRLAN